MYPWVLLFFWTILFYAASLLGSLSLYEDITLLVGWWLHELTASHLKKTLGSSQEPES